MDIVTAPRRVIIDCDPGNGIPGADIDDGLALALAVSSATIHLDMVTVVSGNTHRDQGFDVARTFLDLVGLDVPVFAGASVALLEPSAPWRTRQDRNSRDPAVVAAWSAVPAPRSYEARTALGAAAEIVRLVRANPGEITIVAIGPLTNIAQALQIDPGIADLVREVVVMGGAFDVPGFLQELNFGIDPDAARIVLTSGCPITLLPLDATSQTLLRHSDLDLVDPDRSALTRYVVETTRPWIDLAAAWRNIDGCLLHDPLAVALLIDPGIVTTQEMMVDVETRGTLTRGRPVAWTRENLRLHVGLDVSRARPVRVVKTVDNDRLLRTMLSAYHSWPR
ncbi:nucleoside hydrolase [Micromonospora sp. NPDC048830]|uniref:nucleoside hydrolase n=1 Tax=Micromonospora sp. NPDC048830 TaxID=3364257 RepID=UPI003722007A